MTDPDPQPERSRPHLREGLILLGFVIVCLAAVFSVAIPELRQDLPTDRAQTDARIPENTQE